MSWKTTISKLYFEVSECFVEQVLGFVNVCPILVLATANFSNLCVFCVSLAESLDHANDKHKFQISLSSLGNKFPAAILMFAWNFNACYLEELFDLANVAMKLFYSPVLVTPWDPGKCNFHMVGTDLWTGWDKLFRDLLFYETCV